MEFVKTLQALEDGISEVVVWIFLLPKTFFRILFKPTWFYNYITTEWKKDLENRFNEYLSPVIFWLFLAVIPIAILILSPDFLKSNDIKLNADFSSSAPPLWGAPDSTILQESKLATGAFFVLSSPILYMIWLQILKRKPMEKKFLKESFYLQCYCHSPVQFLNILTNSFLLNTKFFLPIFVILIVWLIIAETTIFHGELKVGWGRAMFLAAVPEFSLIILSIIFMIGTRGVTIFLIIL